jgi:DNA-binding NarL/FixJ family response regulator
MVSIPQRPQTEHYMREVIFDVVTATAARAIFCVARFCCLTDRIRIPSFPDDQAKEDDMRVVLVDDHGLFRASLALWLARHDVTVVGEAAEATAAYPIVDATQPDVVVVDLHLPGSDGIAAVRELVRRCRQQRVLVLTMRSDARFAALALSAGACGYALKADEPEELRRALDAVMAGERYVAPSLQRETARLMSLRKQPFDSGLVGDLSAREREVFDLLARGFDARSVAAQLCISIKTVDTHRTRIMRKLGVHSTAALILFAVRHDLVSETIAVRSAS